MAEWTAPDEPGADDQGRPQNGPPSDDLGPLSGVEGPGETLSFETTLRPKDFLGLSLKNGLLNIVTLTLWRFWGKTEVRRRVWRGVRMNGDAFEYTGRGIELFIGFLLALVVLGLPFLLVVFGVQFMDPLAMFAILIPLYIFTFWLWGFGIFTAFRYMASRTTWRGIRFRLAGSAVGYGGMHLLYLLLTGITLGWFQPEAHRNLAQRTWDNLYFGTRRIRFRMERSHARGVYGMFALGWFGQIAAYILVSGVVGMLMFGLIASGVWTPEASSTAAYFAAPPQPDTLPAPETPPIAVILAMYGVFFALIPVWMLVWAPYQAAILRSIVAGITLDKAGFKLDVRAMPLWWLTVTNLFFLLITLGFLMPWVQARTVKFMTGRLTSAGEVQLDRVEQTGTGPRTGEGLADAFGFSII